MAFFTTIPISNTAPIPDMTLSVVLVKNRAIATPENANGMENMIMKGIFNDSNWDAITRYTSIRLTTIRRARSINASIWSSIAPEI